MMLGASDDCHSALVSIVQYSGQSQARGYLGLCSEGD